MTLAENVAGMKTREIRTKFQSEDLGGIELFENIGLDRRRILNWVTQNCGVVFRFV
jgi:hypothetical protein